MHFSARLWSSLGERSRQPLWRNTFLVLAILHVVFQLGWWLPMHLTFKDDNRDLFVYHRAAQHAARGEKFYAPLENYGPDQVPGTFLYPPVFAAAILPLGHLSLPDFARLWYCILLLFFWIYAATLAYIATGRLSVRGVLVAGLLSAMFPGTMQGMSLGNVQPIINALWGLAFACGARAQGMALAAAALIKIHPLLSLLLAWRHQKASRWPSIAVLLIGIVVGIGFFGWQAHLDWWRYVRPVVSQSTFFSSNISLGFLPLRLWEMAGGYHGGPLPAWARLYLLIIGLGAPLWTLWLLRRAEPRLQTACVGCSAVIFAPLCWIYYWPMLLVPLALLIRQKVSQA